MADPFEQKLADDFYNFVKGEYDDVKVKVFLCGEGLDAGRDIEQQADGNLRAYLKVNVEKQVKGCTVTLAEHNKLIDAYNRAIGDPTHPLRKESLTDYELQLAKWADLIVILPSSAGSIAELGMFALAKAITPKLLIFFDQKYGFQSYIWNGPIRAAAPRGSRVVVTEYKNADQILETVVNRVRDEKSIKRSSKLFGEER